MTSVVEGLNLKKLTGALVVLGGIAACASDVTTIAPSVPGAQSVIVGAELDGEVRFWADQVPLQLVLPDEMEGGRGLLIFSTRSLGAIRLAAAEVATVSDGLPLEELGREVGAEKSYFTFEVGVQDFAAQPMLPDWASEVELEPRDLTELCRTYVLGRPLDVIDDRYQSFLPLGDGGGLLIGRGDAESAIYRIHDLSVEPLQLEFLGALAGRYFGAAILGEDLVFHGRASRGSGLLSAKLDEFLEQGTSAVAEPELIREEDSARFMFAPSSTVAEVQAVMSNGDIYRRDAIGAWTLLAEGISLPEPTGCAQANPAIEAKPVAAWQDSDALYVGLSYGTGIGTRMRILRLTADGPPQMECIDPQILVPPDSEGSIKITAHFLGGPTGGGFVAQRMNNRLRMVRSAETESWERLDGFDVETDIEDFLEVSLGDDAPPGYVWAGENGTVGLSFSGGPSCEPFVVDSDQLRFLIPFGDGLRFLVVPAKGQPVPLTLQ